MFIIITEEIITYFHKKCWHYSKVSVD
jgi:hypothetical protein